MENKEQPKSRAVEVLKAEIATITNKIQGFKDRLVTEEEHVTKTKRAIKVSQDHINEIQESIKAIEAAGFLFKVEETTSE